MVDQTIHLTNEKTEFTPVYTVYIASTYEKQWKKAIYPFTQQNLCVYGSFSTALFPLRHLVSFQTCKLQLVARKAIRFTTVWINPAASDELLY